MYYVYGYYDPGCGCCPWEYIFEEFEGKESAQEYAAEHESDGYVVTLIKGEEISFGQEERTKAKEAKRKKPSRVLNIPMLQ